MPIQRRNKFAQLGDSVQGIVDMMLRSQIQEQSQMRQAALTAQRQEEQDRRTAERQRQQSMLEDQQQRGAKQRENVSGIFEGIDSAKTLEELPSQQGLTSRLGLEGQRASGPIGPSQAMSAMQGNRPPSVVVQAGDARAAKDAAIRAELGIKEDAQTRIGPGGVEGFWGRSGSFNPTERTGQQEGARGLAEHMAGPEMDPTAIGTKILTGASQAGANRNAVITAEHGMRNQLGDIAAAQRKPEDAEASQKADQMANYYNERVERGIQSVDELLPLINRWSTGAGSALAVMPETQARDFAAQLETLKSTIGFSELTAMRAASPTGGALGQISDRENVLLSSALGALDPGQKPETVKQQLLKVKAALEMQRNAIARGRQRAGGAPPGTTAPPPVQLSPEEALRRLQGGN